MFWGRVGRGQGKGRGSVGNPLVPDTWIEMSQKVDFFFSFPFLSTFYGTTKLKMVIIALRSPCPVSSSLQQMNLALRWRNQSPSQEAVKPCINVGPQKHILSKGQGGVDNWGDEPGLWLESDQKEGSLPLGSGGDHCCHSPLAGTLGTA